MDVYVFANQKGGVGKTTVTTGFATEVTARGARCLAVDLDPQASLTKVVGVDVAGRASVADALLGPERFTLAEGLLPTEWGFDLAPSETALASREARRATADEFILRRHLEQPATTTSS
jgi:chromosome partitioning protein